MSTITGSRVPEPDAEGVVPAPEPDAAKRARGRILVLTAGVGAGHDGAARAWADRLDHAGYETRTVDLLTVLRPRRRRGLPAAYEGVLRRSPWIYQIAFRAGASRAGVGAGRLILRIFRRRVAGLVAGEMGAADAAPVVGILCTYPVAGQVLGRLRTSGVLQVPVAVFLTDASVHPLCVSPGVDAHLALHPVSAAQARSHGAGRVHITGALVGRQFTTAASPDGLDRRLARISCGLPQRGRLALIVAGSWGVGRVERTAAEIATSGCALPVILCGRNERLRARLLRRRLGLPLGWVDDMSGLMRAADVLIENAGGLTSLEAMAVGLPVISYRPIAGHGRENAEALARAGASRYVRTERELVATLTEMFRPGDPRSGRADVTVLFRADDPVLALESVWGSEHPVRAR